jgi:hypothetical protein
MVIEMLDIISREELDDETLTVLLDDLDDEKK